MIHSDHVCLLCMRETASPGQYPCPFCGGDDRTLPIQSPALPPRTVLDGRYVVGRTLGQGGFGITYQAYDLRMGNTVAIKEYFPSSLVGRDSSVSATVTVNAIKGPRAQEEYASGLRHFLFEARRQARLASSPGVVSVTDFFEHHNTAYYVMEYVDGSTLVEYMKQPKTISEVVRLLDPIADSLVSIHEAGLIHRDISPDNIMCARNGQRKLLDFGASHSFTEAESTTGNATLKHGFAPPEQYGSSSMQGPWTDVYAFAATVYWCLTGKIPQDSMDRSIGGDLLRPPSELGAIIPPEAEAVLMRGMALPVTARYQEMAVFWNKLKKAAAGSQERLNIPVRPVSAFTDPDGKTTTVTSISVEMETPEQTKVPERSMEFPRSLHRSVVPPLMEDPGRTVQPEAGVPVQPPVRSRSWERPAVSAATVEDPDITIYRPERRPVTVEEPAISSGEPTVPVRTDRRVTAALVLVIAVLLALVGYLFIKPHLTPAEGDTSSVVEQTVTIAGTAYSMDTTALYLTGDLSFHSPTSNDAVFTQVDTLSLGDWVNICQLTGLKQLSLVNCNLSTIAGIEALTGLEVLDITGNSVTDLSPLSGLSGLSELYAADNHLSGCTALSNTAGLVDLDLSGNHITHLQGLENLTALRTLFLQRNGCTDLTPISSLTGLETLDVAENGLESLHALTGLTSLKMLYVDGNHLPNSKLLEFHNAVPDCALDVDVLTSIPAEITIGKRSYSTSLTKLVLNSSSLTDEDIKDLKYMVNLTELELSGNTLSDLSPIARLYNLTYLGLSHNHIRDLSFVSDLIHLDTLLLSSNQISDLTPLSNLTELTSLAIGNNPATDLTPLSGLTKLETLAMCDFNADSLQPLHALHSLFEVRVSQYAYADADLHALKAAVPGCTINQYDDDAKKVNP